MVSVRPPILIQMRYPRARRDYTCHNCGDVITKGTYHEESVIRLGMAKYKDPLVHWRMHSDCQAPWWQPWAQLRLTHVGALPKRVGDTANDKSILYPIAAIAHHASIGHFRWDLPEHIVARIYQSKRPDMVEKATREIEEMLTLIANALVAVVGNRKQATQLSHVLNEMVFVANGVTKPPTWA